MPITPSNLALLRDACCNLLDNPEFNDFWVLAGLTERSFEDGDRILRSKFINEVKFYESIGLPQPMSAKLRRGINGNLHDILANRSPWIRPIRNMWTGQDLTFMCPGNLEATVEVKLVFDQTLPRFFANVAHDREKLSKLREQGFRGDLFAIVFFITFPNYLPPSGEWSGVFWKGRAFRMRNSDIADQFGKAAACFAGPPAWPPQDAPYKHKLHIPAPENLSVIKRSFDTSSCPSLGWHFDPEVDLRGAEVGMAIWQFP
jgi:hypothetical protein